MMATAFLHQRLRLVASGAALALVLLGSSLQALSQAERGDTVTVVFRQMNAPVEVPFVRFSVQTAFDPAKPEQSRVQIRVLTNSLDFGKGAEDYNREVQGKLWFDSAAHPEAVFVGEGVVSKGDSRYEMPGRLTIKGRTVPLTVPFRMTGNNRATTFEGQFPIRRLAFNIGEGEWRDTSLLQDEVLVKFRLSASPSIAQTPTRTKP